MDYLELGEYLGSLQLVNFMGEIVSCSVKLNGKLQLSYYHLIDNDLQSNITDWNIICKSTLNLDDLKPRVFVIFNKLFY